jgi:hypothetical protein
MHQFCPVIAQTNVGMPFNLRSQQQAQHNRRSQSQGLEIWPQQQHEQGRKQQQDNACPNTLNYILQHAMSH